MDYEDWVVVVPVKGWTTAKSRMGGLSRDDRRELALAMASDTVRAVTATPGIRSCLVVGPSEVLRDLGCQNGDDSLRGLVETTLVGQVDTLNLALRRGRDVAVASGWRQVAMVVADLPGISAGALREFLQLVPETAPGFIPDSSGTGTNCWLRVGVLSWCHDSVATPRPVTGQRERRISPRGATRGCGLTSIRKRT